MVSYNYDAWGNIVSKYFFKYGVANAKTSYSITLGMVTYTAQDIDGLNSHYYRGYYLDKETDFYYLTTRYYDPKTGRFISADDPQYLDFEVAYGYNRYAYCCNNPVMGYDPEGTFSVLAALLIGAVAGAIIGGMIGYNKGVQEGKSNADLFWSTAGGVLLGGVIGFGAAGLLTAGIAAVYGGVAGVSAAFWGTTASKAVAIGLLAYNSMAVVVGPILGVSFELVGINPTGSHELTKHREDLPQDTITNMMGSITRQYAR